MEPSVSDEMWVGIDENDPMYDTTFTVYPPSLPRQELEETIVFERLALYNSPKPYGAKAIRGRLQYLGLKQLPSISTINRILSEHCLTNCRTGYYPEDYR